MLLPGGWFEVKMYTKSLNIVSCRKITVQNLSYAVKDEQVWNSFVWQTGTSRKELWKYHQCNTRTHSWWDDFVNKGKFWRRKNVAKKFMIFISWLVQDHSLEEGGRSPNQELKSQLCQSEISSFPCNFHLHPCLFYFYFCVITVRWSRNWSGLR